MHVSNQNVVNKQQVETWGVARPDEQDLVAMNDAGGMTWCAISEERFIDIFSKMRKLLERATEICYFIMRSYKSGCCKRTTCFSSTGLHCTIKTWLQNI